MPYINRADRDRLELSANVEADTPGELNYLIAMLAQRYLAKHGKSYATINAIVGALECAKTEFYRRVAVPYEVQKIVENGDVY